MTSERVTIPTPAAELPSHLWRPPSGSGPGVLLLHEIFGISRYIERRAADLSELGYVVLAPEIFWRVGVTRIEEGPGAIDEALSLVQRVDWTLAVQDASLALDELGVLPGVSGGVGVVGFCFGGGLAFNVAAECSPDVLVSYYGSALRDLLDLAPAVTAPSLHHFGLSDSFVDVETVARIEDAVRTGDDVVFATYPGADHAFDNPDFDFFDAGASALAWQRTVDFLAAHLGDGVQSR